MKAFDSYVATLDQLGRSLAVDKPDSQDVSLLSAALDGGPSRALREVVSVLCLRAIGAFFTPQRLACELAARAVVQGRVPARAPIVDPACGAGDLLIACARRLPLKSTLFKTIRQWEKIVYGIDQHREFVDAAKTRLVLLAASRHKSFREVNALLDEPAFPNIRTGDFYDDWTDFERPVTLVLNPPFTIDAAPEHCGWATGSINKAALFITECLENTPDRTRLVAILPEVLRSGPRYRAWREYIRRIATVNHVALLGQFATWADVDVFLLDCKRCAQGTKKRLLLPGPPKSGARLSDRCTVAVGAVVPHRHSPRVGPKRAYLTSRDVRPWAEIRRIACKRRFKGSVTTPPFVVIKRTSRPTDDPRAAAAIVTGKRPVAVENHLIIVKPNNGSLERCRALLRYLRKQSTTTWLNKRARCRHLTANIIQALPFTS